jgi:hypothetical protein
MRAQIVRIRIILTIGSDAAKETTQICEIIMKSDRSRRDIVRG